jgi:hypothetical protein
MKHNASAAERDNRQGLLQLLKSAPIPDSELLMNLPLFLTRQNLSQILFMHELYQHIIDVHGVIFEFGVRWGRNLALYESFRGLYEPFNHNRRIVGFDTFEGFPSVDPKDGDASIVQVGAYNVTEGYQSFLSEVLERHERESPISHIRKYELVQGDASKAVPAWLKDHPETIVAFAYFDFDIYEPTLKCLEAIKPHLTKGSVIGFDELNNRDYPGETRAVAEALGLGTYAIRHSRYSPTQSYLIVE